MTNRKVALYALGAVLAMAVWWVIGNSLPIVVPGPNPDQPYREHRGDLIRSCKRSGEVPRIHSRADAPFVVKAMVKCMAAKGYTFAPYTRQCSLSGPRGDLHSLWPAVEVADCFSANDPKVRWEETPPRFRNAPKISNGPN